MALEPDSLLGQRGQLPDDLREEATKALQKVGAYLGSSGDPAVMRTFKEPPGFTALLYLTGFLATVLWILSEIGNYYEITNNWSHYQCTPSVAPFAKFYGHDLQQTMSFCISQQVQEHAGGVVAPIYKGINEVQGIVDGVFAKVEAVEGGVMGLIKGFENFVVNFVNSFRLLGTRVRMSFIRIKEIFARVYGIFIAFAYAAISAITFGENLICNPLVTFVAGFAGVDICCFAPETGIRMADGAVNSICTIGIGEELADGSLVTAVMKFNGSSVPMVSINGIHVSGNHSYKSPVGEWITADKHPDALPVPSYPRIWCLNTTSNMIPVVPLLGDIDIIFTDYEETCDPVVAAEAQAAAESALNNGVTGSPMADYGLGVDPEYSVLMENAQWKLIHQIAIGDRVANGAVVTGIVQELCQDVCLSPAGHRLSAAQLVQDLHGSGWFRTGKRYVRRTVPTVLYQLFLDQNVGYTVACCDELLSVRDYQEWHDESTQAPYDAWLAATTPVTKVDDGERPGTPCPNDDNDEYAFLNPYRLASRALS